MTPNPTKERQKVEQIVKGLSESRQRAIRLLDSEWQAGPMLDEVVLDSLTWFREAGLVERKFMDMAPARYTDTDGGICIELGACWHFRLTPLGLAVRSFIQENGK
jgi:hypothetical protein